MVGFDDRARDALREQAFAFGDRNKPVNYAARVLPWRGEWPLDTWSRGEVGEDGA